MVFNDLNTLMRINLMQTYYSTVCIVNVLQSCLQACMLPIMFACFLLPRHIMQLYIRHGGFGYFKVMNLFA